MAETFLPAHDRAYLESKNFQYREVNDGVRNGLIIDKFPVTPEGKFSCKEASLLIVVPQGYADVPPDMFYFSPALTLASNGTYPDRANVFIDMFKVKWQQWSRHADASSWRGRVDGINSYIMRVLTALKAA